MQWVSLTRPAPVESSRVGRQQRQMVERCDVSSLPFFFVMDFEPTYTTRQFALTVLIGGITTALIQSGTYILLYYFLYVKSSFLFSAIYIIPLVCIAMTLIIFKHRFVWGGFGYLKAFWLCLLTGVFASILFGLFIYVEYRYFGLEDRSSFFNEDMKKMFSPWFIAMTMTIENIILTIIYSAITALFGKNGGESR